MRLIIHALSYNIALDELLSSVHVPSLVQLLPHTKKVKRGPKNWRVVRSCAHYLGKCIGDWRGDALRE